jgi:NADPH:quinone reductase-like Zn-dependent oxidoreductase
VTIDAGELEDAPSHLSSIEAAALPLTGLTAWRATMVKSGNAQPGKNILITGIGGGVAIMALLFAAAAGANVYVSSGSQEKIDRAKTMGAKGGINYKEKGWEKTLKALLPKDRAFLDAIIDGAGGDVVEKGAKLLKVTSSYYLTSYIHCNHFTDILFFSQPGGVISIYGMTTSPTMPFQMAAVLKNIEVRGSTMGSRKEFADMVKFVQQKNLKPIVSRSVSGGLDNLEGIDSLFEDMKAGKQFGKLVIEVSKEREAKL